MLEEIVWFLHGLGNLKVLFSALQQQAWPTDDVAHIYDKCISDLEQHLHAIPPALAMNPQTQAIRSLLEAVVMARNSRDGIAALGLLQKVRTWWTTLYGGGVQFCSLFCRV